VCPVAPVDPTAQSTIDYYQFSVQEEQDYLISLPAATGLMPGTLPQLWWNGEPMATIPQGPNAVFVHLLPGTYQVGVNWAGGASQIGYQLRMTLLGAPEVALPLTSGPAPTLSLRLVNDAPPHSPTTPPTALAPSNGMIQPVATFVDSSLPTGIFLALSDKPLGGSVGGTDSIPGASDTALVAGPNAAQGYRGASLSSALLLDGWDTESNSDTHVEVADGRHPAVPPQSPVKPQAASEIMDRLMAGMAKLFREDLKALDALFASRGELPLFALTSAMMRRHRGPALPDARQLAALTMQAMGQAVQSSASLTQELSHSDKSVWSPSTMAVCLGALSVGFILGLAWNHSGGSRRSQAGPSLGEATV
jgi:hypothetical protein